MKRLSKFLPFGNSGSTNDDDNTNGDRTGMTMMMMDYKALYEELNEKYEGLLKNKINRTISDVENIESRIYSLEGEKNALIGSIEEKNELIEYYEQELEALKKYVNYLELKMESMMNGDGDNNNNSNNHNNNSSNYNANKSSSPPTSSLSSPKIDLWNPLCLVKKFEATSAYEKLTPSQKKATWTWEVKTVSDEKIEKMTTMTTSSVQKKSTKKAIKYDDHWNRVGFK